MERRQEWDTNRSEKRKCKRYNAWCIGCDRDLVRAGTKCSVCGLRENKKINKKSYPLDAGE